MMRCEMVAASHQTRSMVGPRMIPNAAIGFISPPNSPLGECHRKDRQSDEGVADVADESAVVVDGFWGFSSEGVVEHDEAWEEDG